jgi:hypothetical protein
VTVVKSPPTELQLHRTPLHPLRARPCRNGIGQPQQLAPQASRVEDVDREGDFVADRSNRTIRDHRTVVAAVRERGEVAPGRAAE